MNTRNFKLSWSVLSVILVSVLFGELNTLCAQGNDSVPGRGYYQGFIDYYQGDYRGAGRIFQRAHRSALQSGQERYLDSVCTLTMMGECFFQVGDYAKAVTLYEEALQLYINYVSAGWQSRVKLPPAISERNNAVQSANITWGKSRRSFSIPNVPSSMSVMFGEVGGVDRAFNEGGVARDAEFRSVNIEEIMRCTGIALHRRRWIKGATCKYDPFSRKLLDGLAGYAGGNGTLLGAWNGVLVGMAQAGVEKYDEAERKLTASLQFGNGMDHALTPVALLTLADLQRLKGKNTEAAILALEASYSGAIFNQYDMVGEAIKLGAQIHLVENRSVYPPLEPVLAWSRQSRNQCRLCEAIAIVRLADCFGEMGETALCARAIGQATQLLRRDDLGLTPESARAEYLAAVVQYVEGDYARGSVTLKSALNNFSRTSRWLYQLGLAESLAVSGNVTERQADLLYRVLLRDPTAAEWKTDPIEAMTFMATNHLGSLERWFEIIVSRKDYERAIKVSELLKRHRFFSTLPMGGRLLSFRWMMEAPVKNLSRATVAQRAEFNARFPAYGPLSQQATQIQNELLRMPLQPADDSDELQRQTNNFVQLQKIANAQESMLASVALRRQAADMNFPPQFEISDLTERIGEDEIAFVITNTSTTSYMFGISRKGVGILGAYPARRLGNAIGKLNRELQILEKQVTVGDLAKQDRWQSASNELADTLFSQIKPETWSTFKRIVIVPDGVTWYLPWEVLRIGPDDANRKMLAETHQFRYSPTVGLAFAKKLPFHRIARSAAFTSRLNSKSEEEQSKLAAEAMLADLPKLSIYDRRVLIPSNLFGVAADQFIVWSAIERPTRGGTLGTYAINPIQLDADRSSGSSLFSWMSLPYRGVDQILLPGFISDGGGGKAKTGGNDMFLMTTGLLASGVRTIGISRWSTSGQSALDLSAEFIRQNKTEDATTAWSNAIKSALTLPVDLKNEPRFKPDKNAVGLTAEHPLFWSGMIIVDMAAERADQVDPDDDADKAADDKDDNANEGDAKEGEAAAGGVADPPVENKEADGDMKKSEIEKAGASEPGKEESGKVKEGAESKKKDSDPDKRD
jgi:tetratricopeptide (TPR) repeat protein